MATGTGSNVDLKIQAIVDGLENVAQLTSELGELERAGSEQVPDNTEQLRQGAGETADVMDTLQNNIGKVVAAGAALGGVAASLRSAIGEATEYDTRFRRINAVLEATGRQGEITAEAIREISQELAEATLGDVAGFEDAATQLLTFRNVSEESLPRILELSKDLAEAGFGSLASNARNLGMALDDPSEGLNRLRRTGVQFSDSQRDMIESLVESGEAAQAQEIILGELQDRVGGMARETSGGLAASLDLASQRWEEFRKKSGEAISPAVESAVDSLASGLESLTENMEGLQRAAQAAGAAMALVAARRIAAGVAALATRVAALGNSMVAAASGARALQVALRALPFATIIAGVDYLLPKFLELRKQNQELADSVDWQRQAWLSMEDRLDEISEEAGRAVHSFEQLREEMDAGTIVFDEAAGRYRNGAEQIRELTRTHEALIDAMELNRIRAGELGEELQDMAEKIDRANRAADLAESFRSAADEADAASAAIRELVEEVDLANGRDVGDLLESIRLLEEESSDLADTVRDELGSALEDLGSESLAEFAQNARAAYDDARIGAEEFARVNEDVVAASFDALGISLDESLGRVPTEAEQARQSIQTIIASIRDTDLAADEMGRALDSAFAAAADQTEGVEATRALQDEIQAAGEAGLLTAEQMETLRNSVAETSGVFGDLRQGIGDLAENELQEVRAASAEAFREGTISAEQHAEVVEKVRDRYQELRDQAAAARADQSQSSQSTSEQADANEDLADSTERATNRMHQAARANVRVARESSNAQWLVRELGWEMERAEAYADDFGAAFDRLTSEMDTNGMSFERYQRRMAAAVAEAARAAEQIERLDQRLEQMDAQTNGAARGVADLELRLLELNGTEEEVAQARLERDQQQINLEIERNKIEAQRARLRGEDELAKTYEQENQQLQRQISLLEEVHRAEREQARERKREREEREREREAESDTGTDAPDTLGAQRDSAPTRTVRIEADVGGERAEFDVAEGQEADVERLFRSLEKSRGASA
ncbi:phage tail length tape measure family protein [Thioalkalivibrio sp. ALgr3]|uniref:phage tail length tape measure family protein n=1 Tax=Thioalkalivibrio sp. ALgr3 TaxID=1239292 RepID=UPI00036C0D28|nr:phage tail length tape measure family protein [Thioalkalivibrio sp. ALgr3]